MKPGHVRKPGIQQIALAGFLKIRMLNQLGNQCRIHTDEQRPIPENTIWIAAVAAQHGLTVVSRDDHFANIAGLPVEVW